MKLLDITLENATIEYAGAGKLYPNSLAHDNFKPICAHKRFSLYHPYPWIALALSLLASNKITLRF